MTTGPAIPLGPFRLDRCIGRGGMAEVWSGVHAAQQVPVAMKVMTGGRVRDESFREAFRNEVQAMASLDHPGIVLVFDHGEIGPEAEEASRGLLPAGSPALAMELADGGTLAQLFPQPPTWPELRRVLLALLDALAHAHARGVVHRDLKPTNILVFGEGGGAPRLKLADFGLAQAVELVMRSDSTEVISGTPTYMAPEQLRGHWRDYGPWTDLYGLGCLAWSLAAGKAPFHGAGMIELIRLQMEERPPAFVPRAPVPHGFEGWLRRLLEKEPGRRFVRAADALCALLELGDAEEGAPAGPEPPAARRSPPLPATWECPATGRPSMRLVGAGLGLHGLRSIPLLGRRAERNALWGALAEVHATGRARLVLLRGVAGVGKSHLASWVAERAHAVGGAIVLRAFHGPNPGAGDGLPRMLARHQRLVGLTRPEVLARTEALLRARKVTEPEEWTGLADLVAPGESPRTARERFGFLERHLARLARQRPVLVLLDDVQWGAEAVAFARHLLERQGESPVPALLLLTARDEAVAERPEEAAALRDLLALPGASALDVPPLSAAERAALTRQVLGLAEDLAAGVDARTGGNPLFAVQLVGDWIQRGLLAVGDTGFTLRPGAEAYLPDDLHEVWADRVARLLEGQPEGAGQALEIAAVLSPFVDRREWEAACRAAGVPCPPGLLAALVASRLALRTEEGWSFVHAMLRESVERLAREAGRFASHNRACAAMLAGRAAAGERGAAERLGRHLLLAGEPAAALEPLLSGARERRETSDYPAALALLARREEALQALAAPATADPRWGEGWVLRARIHLHQGDLAEVFRWAERAEAIAELAGWTSIRSEALRLLGDAARRRGDLDRAAGLYERCLVFTDNPHGEAGSLWGLGDVARQRGQLAEARELFDLSFRLYDEIGDAHGVGDHWIGLADVARQSGDLIAAAALYGQARTRFAALGNRYGVARSLNSLGDVARLGGDLREAAGLYLQSHAVLDELGSAEEVFPRLNLGLLALAEGRFREARPVFEEARELLERMGWEGLLACVRTGLLACAAHAREWQAWDEHSGAAAATLRASGLLDPDLAWTASLAARLADAAGEPARAEVARELAREQREGLGR